MEDPETTPEGLEMTWAVNVAAPFVLAAELLDCITERIVNVSSISLADSLDWENTQAVRARTGDTAGHVWLARPACTPAWQWCAGCVWKNARPAEA
jgi:NAD(P)-dependent dehydrogenase (short-subunit alcohol dehydrogenase family)